MEYGQVCADDQVDELEARNAVLQFEEIRRLAALARTDPSSVKIDVAMVRHLHRFATRDIFSYAGQFRDCPVSIGNTGHRPPPAGEVPGHVEEMVKYITENWHTKPVHLCSYLLWRCNWIHPFRNGNGRTTRGLAYLTFSCAFATSPAALPRSST